MLVTSRFLTFESQMSPAHKPQIRRGQIERRLLQTVIHLHPLIHFMHALHPSQRISLLPYTQEVPDNSGKGVFLFLPTAPSEQW